MQRDHLRPLSCHRYGLAVEGVVFLWLPSGSGDVVDLVVLGTFQGFAGLDGDHVVLMEPSHSCKPLNRVSLSQGRTPRIPFSASFGGHSFIGHATEIASAE